MENFQRELADIIPLECIRTGTVDKQTWRLLVRQLENLLKQHKPHTSWNFLVAVNNGIFLRILCNDLRIEGIVIYEQNMSYRLSPSYNHRLVDLTIHEVCQINGLHPLHIQSYSKPMLHS